VGRNDISFKVDGDFKATISRLEKLRRFQYQKILVPYGISGVSALSSVTPRDTGETAASWSYKIEPIDNGVSLSWHNSNVVNGVNIALILQYGHGTRNGAYIQGIDYINPAIRPIFQQISRDIMREVTNGSR
jgi:hypothetical protein